MWATYKGRTDVVNILLDRHADVNAHGNFHISSLLWAAGRGRVEIIDALIKNGAKINMGDKYGTTALIWASRKGYTEIVRLLLRAGRCMPLFSFFTSFIYILTLQMSSSALFIGN